MENLSEISAEELLNVKGGLADNGPIVNCQVENSGLIIVQPEKVH